MQGKVVVITGAFGILGRAAVARARELGATVAQIDFAPASGGADALTQGGVDLSKADAAAKAIAAVKAKAGRIDALLNIAGGFVWTTVADTDEAVWQRMFTLNLQTAVNACRAATPHLAETGGAIVNVGANSAVKAAAGMSPYAASKAGVHKLTESLAEELKGKVRVNAVLPSIIDTPTNRKDMPDADFASWVTPAELANVLLFLASSEASAVTGALVPVTGRV
jgi:NAD(P)-dependent dehydrogenase (short-subunit alcohol dehydrogenase family)